MDNEIYELHLYRPHAVQYKWHQMLRKHRFRVGVWGRQSGKSTASTVDLIMQAWENDNHVYWFIAPTYSQALVQYRRTMGMLMQSPDVVAKKNQSELRIKLITGSSIVFKSGDRPDNLRTETLNGCVIDEVRDQDPDLFPLIIRPMLATTKGWCSFISTPNGFDELYELAEKAKLDKTGKWGLLHAPSIANPLFTMDEYNEMKDNLPEPIFAQEVLAEFRDLSQGKAYINYSADRNMREQNPFAPPGQKWSPNIPIIIGPDFNLNPMVWQLGQTKAGSWYWGEEIYLENSHTQEAAKELVQRVKGHAAGVIVCGDATGKASQRAAAADSDYDVMLQALKTAGIKWENRTPESNPHIKDRVATMNGHLLSASGKVRYFHSPDCKAMKKDLDRVLWKQGQFILDSGPKKMLTHATDGPGYALCELTPLPSIMDVGTLVHVRR